MNERTRSGCPLSPPPGAGRRRVRLGRRRCRRRAGSRRRGALWGPGLGRVGPRAPGWHCGDTSWLCSFAQPAFRLAAPFLVFPAKRRVGDSAWPRRVAGPVLLSSGVPMPPLCAAEGQAEGSRPPARRTVALRRFLTRGHRTGQVEPGAVPAPRVPARAPWDRPALLPFIHVPSR